jgi:hypothetical protein
VPLVEVLKLLIVDYPETSRTCSSTVLPREVASVYTPDVHRVHSGARVVKLLNIDRSCTVAAPAGQTQLAARPTSTVIQTGFTLTTMLHLTPLSCILQQLRHTPAKSFLVLSRLWWLQSDQLQTGSTTSHLFKTCASACLRCPTPRIAFYISRYYPSIVRMEAQRR